MGLQLIPNTHDCVRDFIRLICCRSHHRVGKIGKTRKDI